MDAKPFNPQAPANDGVMSKPLARSWLFAPGDTPAKLEKAWSCGAGAVILDLEDSVTEANKAAARESVAEFIQRRKPRGPQLWVRINPLSTVHASADLTAVVRPGLTGIVQPKPDSAADVVDLVGRLDALEAEAGLEGGGLCILPIATETAASIFNLGGYGVVGPRLTGLTWGAEDLPLAVGAEINRHPKGGFTDLCRLARSLCLAGAATAGVGAIETVYSDFRDLSGLQAYAEAGRREGFSGMMAIHPAQVAVIEAVFRPSEAQIAEARRIIDLFAANPGAGALSLNGKMLDRPHLKKAERLVSGLSLGPDSAA